MFCQNCGTESDGSNKFCRNCGTPFPVNNSSANPPMNQPEQVNQFNQMAPVNQVAPNQVTPGKQNMPAKKKSNGKIIAIIVAIVVVVVLGVIAGLYFGGSDSKNKSRKSDDEEVKLEKVESIVALNTENTENDGEAGDGTLSGEIIGGMDDEPEEHNRVKITEVHILPETEAYLEDSEAAEEAAPEEDSAANYDGGVEYNGHHYRVYTTVQNWANAKNSCEAKGGHLVVINDAAEQSFIEKLISNERQVYYWIGIADEDNNNKYEWVSGLKSDYTNWDNEQPDNYDGVEHYVMMPNVDVQYDEWMQVAFKWSDVPLEGSDEFLLDLFGYVCEWEE